jgi:hypothetical protein
VLAVDASWRILVEWLEVPERGTNAYYDAIDIGIQLWISELSAIDSRLMEQVKQTTSLRSSGRILRPLRCQGFIIFVLGID